MAIAKSALMPIDRPFSPLRSAIFAVSAKCGAGASSTGGMHIRPEIGKPYFSRQPRCPAAVTGAIAAASNVLETAISVTEERSRRACSQARAMSCSTVDSPFGKCGVIDTGISGVMSSMCGKFTGSFEFYQILERLLEPLPLACEPGDEDVTRYFQPQKSETQEASWNPRAAGVAGADPGGALDAGTRPLARGQPRQTGRARLPGILETRAAYR